VIEGREVTAHDLYKVGWHDRPNGGNLTKLGEGILSFKIVGTEKLSYSGEVFDLVMNGKPNFITMGGISHNCAIWVPPSTYKPFTWLQELIRGEW